MKWTALAPTRRAMVPSTQSSPMGSTCMTPGVRRARLMQASRQRCSTNLHLLRKRIGRDLEQIWTNALGHPASLCLDALQASGSTKLSATAAVSFVTLLAVGAFMIQIPSSNPAVQASNGHHKTSTTTSTTSTSATSTTATSDVKLLATLSTGAEPHFAAYDPADQEVYVTNALSNTTSVISSSTNQVVATIEIDSFPGFLIYDPVNQNMYVGVGEEGGAFDAAVAEISSSTNQVIATIPLGRFCTGGGFDYMAYASSNQDIYIWGSSNCLIAIDPSTNTIAFNETLGVGSGEAGGTPIYYDPYNEDIYLATGYVVSTVTNQVVAHIANGAHYVNGSSSYGVGNDIFASPANHYVYGITYDGLYAFDTDYQLAYTVGPFNDGSYCDTYDPSNGAIYVGGSDTAGAVYQVLSLNVTVHHKTQILTNVTEAIDGGGSAVLDLVYNGANGYIYAVNSGNYPTWDGTVSIIDGDVATQAISVGTHPIFGVYDPANNDVYVLNLDAGTVSILSA